MPSIAIVGTEGCGKTVFIATLAKRYSADNDLGVFMNPQGRATVQYVEQVWHTLTNCGWPPTTPPGQLFELTWRIEWRAQQLDAEIRLVDCAGQDLRRLFADEQVDGVDDLDPLLQQLAAYCRTADIVLLMINLKDIMGEASDERRTANEWAIKYALDWLSEHGRLRRVAVVFTQYDQYRAILSEHGNDLIAVAKAHLPYVYGAHLSKGQVKVMAVSSVWDTQVVPDEQGEPRRVPAQRFRSVGLKEMLQWIGRELDAVVKEQQHQAELATQKAEQERRAEEAAKKRQAEKESNVKMLKAIGGFILSVAVVTTVYSCIPRPPVPPGTSSGASQTPRLQIRNSGAHREHEGLSFEPFGISAWATVINHGNATQIVVRCKVTQGSDSWVQEKPLTLRAGEAQQVTFWVVGPSKNGPNPTCLITTDPPSEGAH